MSEKKNNEVKEAVEQPVVNPAASASKGMKFVDPFAEDRAKRLELMASEDSDDISEERESNSSTVIKTPVPIFHYIVEDKKTGRKYHNLDTSWIQELHRNGEVEEYPMELRLRPRGSDKDKYGRLKLFNILSMICGDAESVPLEVIRTEFENDAGEKIVSYSPRISFVDDAGVEFACRLTPDTDGDKANWDLLVSGLKKDGVLK